MRRAVIWSVVALALLPLLLGGLSIYVIFYSLLPLLLGGLSIYVIFSTRMQLKIKMLITLITGNKGKESKIVVVFQASFETEIILSAYLNIAIFELYY